MDNFKYEIGENCYIYFVDDFEECRILDRKQENGVNKYLTDVHPNWQNEPFLRKCKYVKRYGESCALNNNCNYPNCL